MSITIEEKIVTLLKKTLKAKAKRPYYNAEQITLDNAFVSIQGQGATGTVGSTCRESMASNIKTHCTNGRKSAKYVGCVSLASMATCVRYLNRLEESFGFKGDLTKLSSDRIKLKPGRGSNYINTHVFRLNKEWMLSPTMFQLVLLIIRIFNRGEGKWKGVYSGLAKFKKKDPFGSFSKAVIRRSTGGGTYSRHLDNIQSIGYTLLVNRHKIWGGGRKSEWTADTVITEWGTLIRFNFSESSGPSSLALTLRRMKENRMSSVCYYKFDSKKQLLKEVFLGGGK